MADNVFINGRAAIHKGSAGKSVAFPDVCLCPPAPPSGPIPTPLPNTAQALDLQGGATTVTIEGNPVAHAKSYIAKSTGNEVARSTGGGVITHQVQGAAYFQTFSMNVFIESQPAVRHLDLLTHNHMARMPGNTPPAPWMSTMDGGTPEKPQQASKQLHEGKEWIELCVVDMQGMPAAFTNCQILTPKGTEVVARTLWAGTIKLNGLARGSCQVTFPSIDTRAVAPVRSDDKTGPPKVPCKVSRADKAYQPGRPLSLATGRAHRIELPVQPSFWLQLAVTAKDAATMEDEYILESDDGGYEVRRSVARDHVRGSSTRALEFPEIYEGPSFSLTHKPAGAIPPYLVFSGRPFRALLRPSQWLHRSRRGR